MVVTDARIITGIQISLLKKITDLFINLISKSYSCESTCGFNGYRITSQICIYTIRLKYSNFQKFKANTKNRCFMYKYESQAYTDYINENLIFY